ncbi:MAG: YfiR family protein [Casimicrobiaceae bacterium]
MLWGAVLLVGTWASWHGGIAHAQSRDGAGVATERGVKAAFLYKFPAFVEWPEASFARAESPFVIAVVDAHEIAVELGQITAGRQIQEHPVEIREVRGTDPLTGAHMVFVGRGEPARLQQIARATQNKAVLVASEQEGALDLGSNINLVLREGRVRFEVGLDGAEKRGLKLSSRMLALALQVRGSPP